jgi:hypothetical protein
MGVRDVEAVGARRQNLELRAHLRPRDVARLATELEVDHYNRDAARDAKGLGEVTSATEPGAGVDDEMAARGGDIADCDRGGPAITRRAVAREALRYAGLDRVYPSVDLEDGLERLDERMLSGGCCA